MLVLELDISTVVLRPVVMTCSDELAVLASLAIVLQMILYIIEYYYKKRQDLDWLNGSVMFIYTCQIYNNILFVSIEGYTQVQN